MDDQFNMNAGRELSLNHVTATDTALAATLKDQELKDDRWIFTQELGPYCLF